MSSLMNWGIEKPKIDPQNPLRLFFPLQRLSFLESEERFSCQWGRTQMSSQDKMSLGKTRSEVRRRCTLKTGDLGWGWRSQVGKEATAWPTPILVTWILVTNIFLISVCSVTILKNWWCKWGLRVCRMQSILRFEKLPLIQSSSSSKHPNVLHKPHSTF